MNFQSYQLCDLNLAAVRSSQDSEDINVSRGGCRKGAYVIQSQDLERGEDISRLERGLSDSLAKGWGVLFG